jgi:hypothetical protein
MRHLSALVCLCLVAGCGARPPGTAETSLYDDLRAAVDSRERLDWMVDRVEIDAIAKDILRSVCQTPTDARRRLRAWLARRIEAAGGPAREQMRRDGVSLDRVGGVLTLERVAMALDYGLAHAATDCPFWLRPREDFTGVQTDDGRLVVLLESLGGFQAVLHRGDLNVGGVGGGRLLPAWGLAHDLTLALGGEVGVASTFPREGDGRQVKPVLTAAAPVLLRFAFDTWRLDAEVAATARALDDHLSDPTLGARASLGLGFSALRIASTMPYAGLWLGYERLAPFLDRGAVQYFMLGTRIGLNWDP